MEYKRKKREKSTYVLWAILFLLYLALAFNTYATERLNKKYNSVVSWDAERRQYCEENGNEYLMSGKCSFFEREIGIAVQIFHIYYDEKHHDVDITLEIRENKLGKIVYSIGIGDDGDGKGGWDPDFGGCLYIDQNFNPISMYGEEIDEDMIALMNDLHEEVERVVEIANDKWDLDLHYEYQETMEK